MPRKSQEQIEIEIDALKALRPQMPHYQRGIDVALRVLEHDLCNDTVFNAYEGDELFDDAHSALLWRDGHTNETPSDLYREML